MKAHFKKQYLLQILKKSALNLVTVFFFLESIYLQNSEGGCLRHCYGVFLTEAHFKKQYLLQNSEGGCLKHCFGLKGTL